MQAESSNHGEEVFYWQYRREGHRMPVIARVTHVGQIYVLNMYSSVAHIVPHAAMHDSSSYMFQGVSPPHLKLPTGPPVFTLAQLSPPEKYGPIAPGGLLQLLSVK